MTSEEIGELKAWEAWRDEYLQRQRMGLLDVLDVTLYVLYFMDKLEGRR